MALLFNKIIGNGLVRNAISAILAVSIIGCTTPNAVTTVTTKKLLQFERNQSDLAVKSFTLSSGDTLVYAENSNTTGKPLLLIHGFGGNMDNFTRIAKQLDDYHVIIPDLLGFGESSKPTDVDYHSAAQAKRLHELVQAKGMTNDLHVGGNSMGGAISVAYAAMYPNEVASLWLIDSAGFWSVGVAPALEKATLEDNPLLIDDYNDFNNLIDLTMSKPPFIPSSVRGVLAQQRINNKALEAKILPQVAGDSVEARAQVIAKYNIPTLVVWGEQDKVIKPETAAYIAEIIPQAKVIMMPNIGHVPMLEAVEQSADDYKSFRKDVAAKRALKKSAVK